MNKPPTNPTPFDGYEIPDIKLSTDLTEDSFFWSPRDGEWLSTFPLSDSMIEGMILVDARFCRPIQPATKQEPQPFEIENFEIDLRDLHESMQNCGVDYTDAANELGRLLTKLQDHCERIVTKRSKPFTPESQVERRGLDEIVDTFRSNLAYYDEIGSGGNGNVTVLLRAVRDRFTELQALVDKEKQPTEPNSMSILIDACDDHIAEGEKLLNGPGAVGVLVHPYIKSEIEVSRKLKAWLSGEGNR